MRPRSLKHLFGMQGLLLAQALNWLCKDEQQYNPTVVEVSILTAYDHTRHSQVYPMLNFCHAAAQWFNTAST